MGSVQLRKYDRTVSIVFLKTNEPFGGLSNMAGGYPLYIQGVRIRTSEALYQACRFPHLPHVQRLIIEQASPMTAKMKSKPYREDSRPDWDGVRVKVMRWCLRVKLAQNWSKFSGLLLRSGNSPIVEESRRDDFWGAKRVDQHILVGRNVLGRLLMELREVVKSSGRDAFLHVEPPAIPQFLLFGGSITAIAGRGIESDGSVEADGRQGDRGGARSRGGEQALLLDQPVAKRAPQPTYVSAHTEHLQMDRSKTYTTMKDSGVKWVGDVPEHWDVKRLKMVVHLVDRKVEADEEHPLSYVGMENIESWVGRFLPINPGIVPAGTASEFKAGNTLFGKLRPYLAKACNPDFDGLCSTELLVLKSVEIDCRILLYSLLSDGFIKLVDSSTYGSKMPRTSWDFIGSCVIPIAPPNEQRTIANFLDRETAKIDTLVAKKRTLTERLKEKRTALISRTVTRGLPPDAAHAAGFDPHPKLKPSGIKSLGDMPEHWETMMLKRTWTSCDYGVSETLSGDGPVRVLTMSHVHDGRVFLPDNGCLEEISESMRVRENDLLFNRTNSLLHVAKVGLWKTSTNDPVTFASYLVRIRTNDRTTPSFMNYLLNTPLILEFARSLALPSINQANLNPTRYGQILVSIPSTVEQDVIVDYLDREISKVDTMVAKVEAAIERLQEYRNALITAAVTGKIDVSGTRLMFEPSATLPGIAKRPGQ